MHQYLPPDEFVQAVQDPSHVADSTSESDQTTWDDDIRSVFPDWGTKAATERWPATKSQLQIDQRVRGRVIARAHFGVWVDINVGHPALLLVTNMFRAVAGPVAFTDYAPKGTMVRARIDSLGDDCEIGLVEK